MSPPVETPVPEPSPTVVVELPGGGKPAVAHLPPDVLDKLYPHDFPPNWAEKWTGVGTVGLVVGAILAAIITYLTLRQGRKSRHAETFRDIVETWGNGEFRAVRARIWRVYEDKTAEEPEALENKTAQGLEALGNKTAQGLKALENKTAQGLEALGNKAAATSERLRDTAAATSEILPDKAAGDPERVLQHMRELRVALEDEYWELLIPLEFFENAGMLVKYRAISIQMVDNSLGLLVCEYWKMLRPFIYARRRGIPDWPDERDPGYYEESERLAKRISDRHNDQPPFDFKPRRPRMWFESFARWISGRLRKRFPNVFPCWKQTTLEKLATWVSDKLRNLQYSYTHKLADEPPAREPPTDQRACFRGRRAKAT